MSPVHRDTPQIVPFSWPERLPVPAAVSNVSQNAGVPPSCIPHLLADGVGVGVGVGAGPDPVPDPDRDAEQLALAPPLEPAQLHVHGPEPVTVDAVPVEQRLVDGADDACVPFADPHTPLTGVELAFTATVVLAAGDVPPLPVQVSE